VVTWIVVTVVVFGLIVLALSAWATLRRLGALQQAAIALAQRQTQAVALQQQTVVLQQSVAALQEGIQRVQERAAEVGQSEDDRHTPVLDRRA
jgi:hypothetical protein